MFLKGSFLLDPSSLVHPKSVFYLMQQLSIMSFTPSICPAEVLRIVSEVTNMSSYVSVLHSKEYDAVKQKVIRVTRGNFQKRHPYCLRGVLVVGGKSKNPAKKFSRESMARLSSLCLKRSQVTMTTHSSYERN